MSKLCKEHRQEDNRSQFDPINCDICKLINERDHYQSLYDTTKKHLDTASGEIRRLKEQVNSLMSTISTTALERDRYKGDCDTSIAMMDELRKTLEEANQELVATYDLVKETMDKYVKLKVTTIKKGR